MASDRRTSARKPQTGVRPGHARPQPIDDVDAAFRRGSRHQLVGYSALTMLRLCCSSLATRSVSSLGAPFASNRNRYIPRPFFGPSTIVARWSCRNLVTWSAVDCGTKVTRKSTLSTFVGGAEEVM